jgi:hypothetical protein
MAFDAAFQPPISSRSVLRMAAAAHAVGDPGRSYRQPSGGQLADRLILDLHIMAIVGPASPDERQRLVALLGR